MASEELQLVRCIISSTSVLESTTPNQLCHGWLFLGGEFTDHHIQFWAHYDASSHTQIKFYAFNFGREIHTELSAQELHSAIMNFIRPFCFTQDPQARDNESFHEQLSSLVLIYLERGGHAQTMSTRPTWQPNITKTLRYVMNNSECKTWLDKMAVMMATDPKGITHAPLVDGSGGSVGGIAFSSVDQSPISDPLHEFACKLQAIPASSDCGFDPPVASLTYAEDCPNVW